MKKFAVLALAVAAAALSACAAETTTVTLPATTTTLAPPKPTWVDITGRGAAEPFSAVAKPGVRILHANGAGESRICTLGPVVRRASGIGSGVLTAAHCTNGGAPTPQELQIDAAGATVPLATTGRVASGANAIAGTTMDGAVMWTTAPTYTATIAGTWPVAGVLSVDGVRELIAKGDPICIDGATTGISCGRLKSVSGVQIQFERSGSVDSGGDSGSAVFAVDTRGRAHLIGILQGVDDSNHAVGIATFLDPQLRSLGAKALVDRAAAAGVAGDKRYSAESVPAA